MLFLNFLPHDMLEKTPITRALSLVMLLHKQIIASLYHFKSHLISFYFLIIVIQYISEMRKLVLTLIFSRTKTPIVSYRVKGNGNHRIIYTVIYLYTTQVTSIPINLISINKNESYRFIFYFFVILIQYLFEIGS